MPPVIGAIVAIGAAVGATLVKSLVVKALITIAASVAVSLLNKPKKNKLQQGHELSTRIMTNMGREVLVGTVATGGSCHFAYTRTDSSKLPNRYLYRVIELSDMPITSVEAVLDGPTAVTFAGDITTGWRAATGYRSKEGNQPRLWMRVHLGSFNAVADATLVSETSGVWTNAHKGTGLAYAIIKMDADSDAFPNGEPTFTFICKGAKLYDDRFDSTVQGGSGTQRLNDYSTWAWSDTASVITAQALRGFYNNGTRIIGVGADERDLNKAMLFSAHNTCEQLITSLVGSEKRYTANTILKADERAESYLEDLQAAMDGRIYDRGGHITILPGAVRTPVMNLTDQDIIWTEEKSWQPRASLEAMLNCVTANFVAADKNFEEDDLPVLTNSTWEAQDGGERFTTFFSLRAVTSRSQGQRITKRIHEASRFSGIVGHVGGIWLLELEQGDWYTLTSARWGFSAKYFEVVDITITRDLRVSIVGQEVHPDIDVWDHSVDEKPRTDATWNPPAYNLPIPDIFAQLFNSLDANTGYQTFTIDVGLIDPSEYSGFVKFIDVQILRSGDTDAALVSTFPVDQKKTTITGLAPATNYQVRARTSDGSRYSDWTVWIDATTNGGTRIVAGVIDYVIPPSAEQPNPIYVPVQNLMPAEPGATAGAPLGTNVGGRPVSDIIEDLDLHAANIISLALGQEHAQIVNDVRLFVEGQPVSTVFATFRNEQVTFNSAINSVVALIGAKTPDGTAFVIDLNTTQISPTVSLAQKFNEIGAATADVEASVEILNEVVIGSGGGLARAIVKVDVNGNMAGLVLTATDDEVSRIGLVAGLTEICGTDGTVLASFSEEGGEVYIDNLRVNKITIEAAEEALSDKVLNPNFGFQHLPGGLIMQWGRYRANINNETSFSISFPVAFPNAVMSVTATPYISTPSDQRDIWIQNLGAPTVTGATFYAQSSGNNQNLDGFDWVAFGY